MTKTNPNANPPAPRDDAILPLTRLMAVAVIPFLLAAFVILYLLPEQTARLFAWEIASPLTSALMGAGYLGGAYFFGRVLAERHWHHVAGGFPGVAAFTAVLLAATLLHWDTFDPRHWPFLVWLAIYIATPVLVTLVWRANRRRDPGRPEASDATIPPVAARFTLIAGLILLAAAAFLFIVPTTAAGLWPWPLTPLTARVLAGWLALLGVGSVALARDGRWSAWRIPLQSILLWQLLLLAAFVRHRDAFDPAGLLNWYTLFTLAAWLAAALFYLWMELSRRDKR